MSEPVSAAARFAAPGVDAGLPPDPVPMPMAGTVSDGDDGPQLFGVVLVNGAPHALLAVAADSVAQLLPAGARLGAWRVRRIGTDRVELSSSSGTRVLRLSRHAPNDSSPPVRPSP